jgi:plasmid stabilization system protein ParE
MFSIETSPRFDEELLVILDFIALDSINSALKFHDELIERLNSITDNPLACRQREGMSEETREVIFKGYTIPIYIDHEKNKIFILGIFNQNIWE